MTTTTSTVSTSTSTYANSTTSSTTVSSTPTPIQSCGVAGFDNGTIAYNFDNSTSGTFEACSARCKADVACGSFAIGGGACLLYQPAIETFVVPVEASPFTFYDISCA